VHGFRPVLDADVHLAGIIVEDGERACVQGQELSHYPTRFVIEPYWRHQLFDELAAPTAGDALPELSPFDFPFPSTDEAPSSSYSPFCSIYSMTGAGIKYCTLISLLKNSRIFVLLTSFEINC